MFRIASRSRSLASSWLTRYRTMSAGVAHQLHLTETEDRFINLLDEFAKTGRKEVQEPAVGEVECRIAGGWVRDKVNQRADKFFFVTDYRHCAHSSCPCLHQMSM